MILLFALPFPEFAIVLKGGIQHDGQAHSSKKTFEHGEALSGQKKQRETHQPENEVGQVLLQVFTR